MDSVCKVAIIISHPIQHFCPQFVSFAQAPFCRIKVFFASSIGFKKYMDKSFGREIEWANLGLEKFDHVFLNGDADLTPDRHLDAINITSELTKFGPDLIITFGYFQKFVQRAQDWAIENNLPIAFISDSERRRHRPLIVETVKKFLVSRRFRDIDFFLSVGDANEAYYRHYQVPDFKFIRMGFPIDIIYYKGIFQNRHQVAAEIKAKYQIESTDLCCAVVGKLEHFKRQKDIIEALHILENAENDKPLVLFIIGTGPAQEELEHYAAKLKKNRVIFTGFLYPEEIAKIYTVIDIYIHPSEKDAHSLAVSEAIYMGCPVLISDRCGSYGPNDDVQHGQNGFVYETGNTKMLASLISFLSLNENTRKKFAEFSHQFAVKSQELAHREGLAALIESVKLRKALLSRN